MKEPIHQERYNQLTARFKGVEAELTQACTRITELETSLNTEKENYNKQSGVLARVHENLDCSAGPSGCLNMRRKCASCVEQELNTKLAQVRAALEEIRTVSQPIRTQFHSLAFRIAQQALEATGAEESNV